MPRQPEPDRTTRDILLSLSSEQIHRELTRAEADAEALRVLLRAARARERIARARQEKEGRRGQ
jgi:hypothetical protein